MAAIAFVNQIHLAVNGPKGSEEKNDIEATGVETIAFYARSS